MCKRLPNHDALAALVETVLCLAFCFQSGTDPKQELDKAQYNRMQELLKRKRLTQREDNVRIITEISIFKFPWNTLTFCLMISFCNQY